jgi:hypothetical protein
LEAQLGLEQIAGDKESQIERQRLKGKNERERARKLRTYFCVLLF